MRADSAGSATVESFRPSPLADSERLFAPGLMIRIAARLHRSRLDRALSDGASPAASPLIAARARQLNRASVRSRIAAGLERLALSADGPSGRCRIVPARAAALANRSELLELAGLLRRDRRLYARGIAMLEVTLTDGTGPAYTDRHGADLARRLHVARASLTG